MYVGLTQNSTFDQSELKEITVELNKDIINVKGRRSSIDYKFWTKNYKNQFNILNGSITAGKHEAIANLKAGQKVDLLISSSDFGNLSEGKEDITIKGISLNGNPLMTKEEYYHNQKLYEIRLEIFSLFTSLMLLLNGLAKIPSKINYIISGIFIGAVIIMRIFEFGIYSKLLG